MKETDCRKCCVSDFKHALCKEDFCEKYYREGSAEDFEKLLLHWIPCSERMPDEDCLTGANVQYSVPVLMTAYNAEDEETIVDYGHTVDGRWYSDTTDLFVPSWWEVLAWMPLPEPWKGKE